MNDREWACRWVGWHYSLVLDAVGIPEGEDGTGQPESVEWKSDADLAEAVRVKYVDTYPISVDEVPGDSWPHCIREWGMKGPLAFIAAVRKTVNNG